jgi:hypothetical protein
MDSQSTRYAPMNHYHIPGFPNCLPLIDWQTHLPKFKHEKGYDVALHLVKFHMHIHKLRIEFPEDCLMKMFMETLEERERLWYERLPHASLYSLEDFYSVFCKKYKESYPSIVLVENLCENIDNIFQHMGIDVDDEDLMDDEIKEALFELSSHQKEKVETSYHNNQENKSVVPPLVENKTN